MGNMIASIVLVNKRFDFVCFLPHRCIGRKRPYQELILFDNPQTQVFIALRELKAFKSVVSTLIPFLF